MEAPLLEPKLRKTGLAKSLYATAEIEGNTLSVDQVTTILDGRPIALKHPRNALEVRNAVDAYDPTNKFKPWTVKNFLSAHKMIMARCLISPTDDSADCRNHLLALLSAKVLHLNAMQITIF